MSYTIQRGDTLSQLAQRHGTSVQELARANNIQNVDLIYTGATLQIPGASDSFAAGGADGARRVSSAPSGAPGSVDPDSFGSNAQRLAHYARTVGGAQGTTGWCARGVNDSLEAAGLGTQRVPSAYMAADVLARDSRFREVSLSPAEVRNLPPGAVVVSAPGGGVNSTHGHIAVSLGNGMEASDHVQNIITTGNQRVFIPIG